MASLSSIVKVVKLLVGQIDMKSFVPCTTLPKNTKPFMKVTFQEMSPHSTSVYVLWASKIYPLLLMNVALHLTHEQYLPAAALVFLLIQACTAKAKCVPWQKLPAVIYGSSKSGFIEPWLHYWVSLDKTMISSFTIFVSGSASLTNTALPPWGTCISILTLLMGVHGMATENIAVHLGDTSRQFAKAMLVQKFDVRARMFIFFCCWSHIHMVCEVTLVLAMVQFLGVLAAFAVFIPTLFVKYYRLKEAQRDANRVHRLTVWELVRLFEDPLNFMTMPQSSIFGMPVILPPGLHAADVTASELYHNNIGNKPALPESAAFLARYISATVLLVGICGLQVLVLNVGSVLQPLKFVAENEGAKVLEGTVVLMLGISLPVHVCTLCVSVLVCKGWRSGGVDTKLLNTTRALLQRWVKEVRKAAQDYPLGMMTEGEGYVALDPSS